MGARGEPRHWGELCVLACVCTQQSKVGFAHIFMRRKALAKWERFGGGTVEWQLTGGLNVPKGRWGWAQARG